MAKNNKHKLLLVKEIEELTKDYLSCCKELSSLLTVHSKKETLTNKIEKIEDELKQKLTIASNMKGF